MSLWNVPRLKRGVDLQLQTAYNELDFSRVARLAAKRAAISDRQYHEILKTAAEAQTGLPISRYATVVQASKMLKDGTVVTDVEAFDLLDWATKDVADDGFFCQVLGPLRLRSVKSGKLNRAAMVQCFEACLRNWDLESSQQIAAFLDRSFKQERSFLFWNIAVTFLFATSSECAKEKKALYSTLAARMALKANQDTAAAPKNAALQEEEVLVYYSILLAQGSLKDWQDLMQNESLGPIAQCRLGRKEPLLSALRAYEKFDDWNSIYELTKAAMTDPESTEEAWKPSVLASDWALWQYFLKAAQHVRATKPEVVQEATARIEAASSDSAPAILRRTMILAKILSCFELGEPSESNPDAVKHMVDMIQNLTVVARFEDLRPLVQRMAPSDMEALLQAVSTPPAESPKPIAVVLKQALIGKLRFLISTCPGTASADFAAILKDACASLQSLSYPGRDSAVDEIAALLKDMSVSETKPIKAELSPDFAILIAVTLVKLSGLTPGNVCAAKLPYILQAIAVLENQLHITPKDHGVLILLVRLHTLIGSARRASEVWDVLDVKRTIVDSLAPLFLDRLSTVSPVLVSPTVLASHKITRTVLSYYDNVLSTKMPKSMVQAIHAKSYSSIIQIPEYIQSLKTSSTRAMGYLERRKATRAFTGKPDDWTLASVPVYSETINFGPFPTLESSTSRSIYETLSLGPPPSNERTQLAVLSEKLFSILAFKPPTMYKPSASAVAAEEAFVTEELTRLANSFGHYLTADLSAKLTPAEATYYQTLALLTLFTLSMCPPAAGSGPANKPTVDAIIGSLTDLSLVIEERLASSADTAEKTLKFFSSLHDLWHLRDTACAVRTCLDYITLFNSRQKPAKPPAKDDAANMKALATAAAGALAQGKAWVATAKKTVAEAGFERKVAGLAFGAASEDDGVTEAARVAADIEGTSAANWAKKIVESWKQNIAGWETVKWE